MSILVLFNLWFGLNSKADEQRKPSTEPIDVTLLTHVKTIHRNLVSSPEAIYYPVLNVIEIECQDFGEVSVYIIDSEGKAVAERTFESDFIATTTIDAPQVPGTYWLVIESATIYAEGVFVVE